MLDLTEQVKIGHARGWAFIRVGGSDGKTPLDKGWQDGDPMPLEQVLRWCRAYNIGLRTGQVSGIAVIDIDDGSDAEPADFPMTVTAMTAKKGWHLYYRIDQPIRNRKGTLVWPTTGQQIAGVDLRGDGGQVVYPGSMVNGQQYVWVHSPERMPLATFPVEFLPSERQKPKVQTLAHDMSEAEKRCLNYLAKCPDAVSGQGGHNATFLAACTCWRFGLDRPTVERALDWFNQTKCYPQWSDRELRHKIESSRVHVETDGEIGVKIADWQVAQRGDDPPHDEWCGCPECAGALGTVPELEF